MRVGASRTKGACLCLVLLLSVLYPLGVVVQPADAQAVSVQIVSFEIKAQGGSSVFGDTLLVENVYSVHFTIDVAAGIDRDVILSTDLQRNSDRYWSLVSGDYEGVDVDTWQPGQSSISFESVAGQVSFILEGYIPADYTTKVLVADIPESEEIPETEDAVDVEETPVAQDILHFPAEIVLLQLSLGEGEPFDIRTSEVFDDSISQYRDKLSAKKGLLDTMETEPEYAELVTDIIDQAEQQAAAGRTDHAVALLDTIPDSDWVSPQQESESSSNAFLFIIVAVLAIIALIAIVLLVRRKSESQFLKRRADDEARKLDLIAARINRIGESSIASEITRVKDSLDAISRGR